MFYEIIQMIVALIAVILAVKWKKNEFLAGLLFLFLYTLLSVVDIFFLTIVYGVFLDVAQFGFILLALVFFIIGMNPAWVYTEIQRTNQDNEKKKKPPKPDIFTYLRKL